MTFEQLGLSEPILKALATEGYTTPTPIQAQSIPIVLKGYDLIGLAQTGTGKTAAFALPILDILHEDNRNQKGYKHIRTLILTPTRELAAQIGDSFAAYGRHTGLKHEVIFGGVSQVPQVQSLRIGTDILIATPGRLLDLMNQGYVHLDYLEIFVLDEADRMLDMGFIHDVKKVIRVLPDDRQTLFFSATMPKEVTELAQTILYKPERVEVAPVSSTAETVDQSVYYVNGKDKMDLLVHILTEQKIARTLVFARTKHGADKLAKNLKKAGIRADAIHGDKSQGARQNALASFKEGKLKVLVATDIAARGIDVDALTHVINYDLPNIPESYVHRIGRTGRAGASGIALSFVNGEERAYLKDIQKLINKQIPVIAHPYEDKSAPVAGDAAPKPQGGRGGRGGGGGRNRGGGQRSQGGSSGNGGARSGGHRARSGEGRAQRGGGGGGQRSQQSSQQAAS
ncbi:DEAD/DEAH box helicase [Flaviaesturariibacter amylovorans]|uniref:DEAD/DEAH box helicase n=1 Tax=Flaviaesturariibacter amylovorans TaxID=1084520 RepID=A0ABP8HGE9_9BACT